MQCPDDKRKPESRLPALRIARNSCGPELPPASFSANGFGSTMVSLTGGNPVNSDVRRLSTGTHSMNCFLRTILLIALMLFSSVGLRASPDYPFEGLLPRAKVIFTGRILTHDDLHVTFAVSESLRGQTETHLTFGYSSITDKALASVSNEFLVLSQGDDYWGKPEPVVSLGQQVKGQVSYLGWIAFPCERVNSSVRHIFC